MAAKRFLIVSEDIREIYGSIDQHSAGAVVGNINNDVYPFMNGRKKGYAVIELAEIYKNGVFIVHDEVTTEWSNLSQVHIELIRGKRKPAVVEEEKPKEEEPIKEEPMDVRTCPVCGKQLAENQKKFCSRECMYAKSTTATADAND